LAGTVLDRAAETWKLQVSMIQRIATHHCRFSTTNGHFAGEKIFWHAKCNSPT
jgi:hypothetical protein